MDERLKRNEAGTNPPFLASTNGKCTLADFVAASDLLSLRFVYPEGKDILKHMSTERVQAWYSTFLSQVPAAQEVHDIIGKIADISHAKHRALFEPKL